MIWNDEVLFLHVPKTGGISLTAMLLGHLRGPVSYTADTEERSVRRGRYHPGRRHETLADAESFLTYRDRSIFDFEAVFAVMRNPYDLEVSRYHYLRKGLAVDRGPAQELALAGDFAAYLESASFFGARPPRLDRYFHLAGVIPPNLRVLRYEHLADDVARHLGPHLVDPAAASLPHLNPSRHDDFGSYYDEVTEALCYARHRWFFDVSFYRRGDLGAAGPPPERPGAGSTTPATPAGPVEAAPPLERFPAHVPARFSIAPWAGDPQRSLDERGRAALERLRRLAGRDVAGSTVLDVAGDVALERALLLDEHGPDAYVRVDADAERVAFLDGAVGDPRATHLVADAAASGPDADPPAPDAGLARWLADRVAAAERDDGAPPRPGVDVVHALSAQRLDPERLAALARFARRHVRPDGRLLLGVVLDTPSEGGHGLADRLAAAAGEGASGVDAPTAFRLGPATTWILPATALEALLDRTGWSLDHVEPPTAESPHVVVATPA